jgi:NAD(P)-dependent dehydrogenase (short-subunit alcohol dehydrogenase family)
MPPRDYTPAPGLLQDRVVLVTGATGGIGRALALACARHGATVVLHGRRQNALESLYDEIVAAGGPEPAALPLDLAAAGSRHYDALAADIDQAVGRLDGIVHCAAHTLRLRAAEGISAEDWTATLAVNVTAALSITRACLPLLRQAPQASVVYSLESHHDRHDAYLGALAVPGAALAAAVRIQAREWAAQAGVRCNAVVPGPLDSPARRRTHPGEARGNLPGVETVIPAYLWLLGPDSLGVSGSVVDGSAAN